MCLRICLCLHQKSEHGSSQYNQTRCLANQAKVTSCLFMWRSNHAFRLIGRVLLNLFIRFNLISEQMLPVFKDFFYCSIINLRQVPIPQIVFDTKSVRSFVRLFQKKKPIFFWADWSSLNSSSISTAVHVKIKNHSRLNIMTYFYVSITIIIDYIIFFRITTVFNTRIIK